MTTSHFLHIFQISTISFIKNENTGKYENYRNALSDEELLKTQNNNVLSEENNNVLSEKNNNDGDEKPRQYRISSFHETNPKNKF